MDVQPEPEVLQLTGVKRSFMDSGAVVPVLRGIDLHLAASSSVALMGASGSGKSTLLLIAAGLDRPDGGQIRLLGQDPSRISERELTLLRRRDLGFVFQQYNLLPGLSVQDNLMFQTRLSGLTPDSAWIGHMIESLQLAPLLHRTPERLSGGEQQRAAIARALAHRPRLVFADEPTGNLNDELSRDVMSLLLALTRDSGCSLLLATHNPAMATLCGRTLRLSGGRLAAA